MNKSVGKNYIYNLLYQSLTVIAPLLITPYVSRVLGAEAIGIYSYTLSIATYFILFGSLGVSLYGQREIAFYQNDKKKYSLLFWEIFLLRLLTLSISMLVFGFTVLSFSQYSLYYKVLLIEIIANCFDISWFFQGMEEFKKILFRNFIIKFSTLFLVFFLVKSPDDLLYYFFIYVLSNLMGNLSLWFYLKKYLQKISFRELKIFRHFLPTIILFIPQITIKIYTLLDKSMLGLFLDNKMEVGYYDQAQKIILLLLTIVTSLGTVMLPRIASTFASGDKEKVNYYISKSFHYVFLISIPMTLGIILVAHDFVPIYFGENYDSVILLMQVIAPIIFFVAISNVIGIQYLLPTKKQKEYTLSVSFGALVNVIANVLLIPTLGALGACIGSVIAEFVVSFTQMIFTKKDFNYVMIFQKSWKYFVAGFFMIIGCFVLKVFSFGHLVNLIMTIMVGCFIYFIVLFILRDELLLDILKFIKRSDRK